MASNHTRPRKKGGALKILLVLLVLMLAAAGGAFLLAKREIDGGTRQDAAPWCGPCKMVAPIIEELAAEFEGQVIIGKCDVDDNSDVAAEYGIRNIPTVLFFKNGEIVDKQVGAVAKPVFVEKVKNLL